MSIDFLSEYIVLVAFGVCVCVGFLLKQWTLIPNNIILPVLAILGVIINMWVNEWLITPEILLGGMASGIAASGVYEYVQRFISKDEHEIEN